MPANLKHIVSQCRILPALLILLFLSPYAHKAQTAGYLGKKVLLKTNVVNGLRLGFNNADIECVLGKKISLTVSYEALDYKKGFAGLKRKTGDLKPRNSNGEYKEFSTLKNGRTKGWLAGIGCKIYFNSIIPAPYGFYTSFSVGYGHATLSDFEVSYTTKEKLSNIDKNAIGKRPDVTGLGGETKVYMAELPALGFQRIFKGFITLDSKIAVQTLYCQLPDNVLNAFEHNYYVRANTVSYGMGNFSVGLSAYIKIGFLLF